jgi:hypothetical protein
VGSFYDFWPWQRAARSRIHDVKEVHMSCQEEASSHRAMWLMLIGAVVSGLFAFWFVRARTS